jgi:dihydrolipoamide dehydrogenase
MQMSEQPYDVVVIGAGPGGYVTAIRAAQLGLRVAVVERGALGGVCLNVGCIPTKALLHSAELLDAARDGARFGVVASDVRLDWAAVTRHRETVVKTMTGGVGMLLRKNRVETITGTARLRSAGVVAVSDAAGATRELATRHVVIATGARPREIPAIGAVFDGERILSSTQALSLPQVPASLAVIGAGAIGVEFASAYRSFGAEVTLIEALPRIVPVEDEDVSAELARAFARRGIAVLAGARVEALERRSGDVVVRLRDAAGAAREIAVERVLVGAGIVPNTADLGLADVGVTTDARGFIAVDAGLRTSLAGVFAIGDCASTTPWLAHKASAEGILVAETIAGHAPPPLDYRKIPGCTYCTPEIASIGLSEAAARQAGHEVKIGRFPFTGNGKATVLGQRQGFVKIVSEATYGEVLGVHIIGPHATELIAEAGVALSHEATAESLMRTVHAHPTVAEAILEAAHMAATGLAIHI